MCSCIQGRGTFGIKKVLLSCDDGTGRRICTSGMCCLLLFIYLPIHLYGLWDNDKDKLVWIQEVALNISYREN